MHTEERFAFAFVGGRDLIGLLCQIAKEARRNPIRQQSRPSALKNSEPPVDVVLNPAFTPVTADFRASHFEARRAVYACTVFCNFAVFGGSCFESPEKAAPHVDMAAGEERLEVAELPIFAIRAEREAWDARAHRRFIQSTRR